MNQTEFGTKGDALQACFASLLGEELSAAPNSILEADTGDEDEIEESQAQNDTNAACQAPWAAAVDSEE